MRMKLDISIQAPEITVPLSSISRDIVVLDLGQLTLVNEFVQLDVGFGKDNSGKDNSVVLYEQYSVKLTDLQMYRYMKRAVIVSAGGIITLVDSLLFVLQVFVGSKWQ